MRARDFMGRLRIRWWVRRIKLTLVALRDATTLGENVTKASSRSPRFEGHEYPQVIPEPDDVATGKPAPWAKLSERERNGLSLELVRQRLDAAHRLLASSPLPHDPVDFAVVNDDVARPFIGRAAVLVALFEEEGESHVVLTRRARTLSSHRGDVALPGGRSELDESAVATALRETHEEVGIEPSLVTPEAWLTPLVTYGSSAMMWPIVGTLRERPTLVIDPREVERAFSVSLADLAADDAFLEERWRRAPARPSADADGYSPIHFFRVPGDLIWGATARVLTELLRIVLDVR
jgi:8-oxo-dGTP pyrophosphatase MutT (NUDIX family)